MSDKKQTAKAGRLLCVSEGSYSDYGVVGFFVVLRNFPPLLYTIKFAEGMRRLLREGEDVQHQS